MQCVIHIYTRRSLWHPLHSGHKRLLRCNIYKVQANNSEILQSSSSSSAQKLRLLQTGKKSARLHFLFLPGLRRMEHVNVVLLCTSATLGTRPSKESNFAEPGTQGAHGAAGWISSIFVPPWWPPSSFNVTIVVKTRVAALSSKSPKPGHSSPLFKVSQTLLQIVHIIRKDWIDG